MRFVFRIRNWEVLFKQTLFSPFVVVVGNNLLLFHFGLVRFHSLSSVRHHYRISSSFPFSIKYDNVTLLAGMRCIDHSELYNVHCVWMDTL